MAKHFEGYKATPAEIIAQHWFFSCDAPDTNETAAEIQRLAKMIDTVLAGGEIPWRVVNRSLNAAQQSVQADGSEGHPDGDFSYLCGSEYCRCAQ